MVFRKCWAPSIALAFCVFALLFTQESAGTCASINMKRGIGLLTKYKTKPDNILYNSCATLHRFLKGGNKRVPNQHFASNESVQLQMSEFYRQFDISTWISAINKISQAQRLDAFRSTELHFHFTHWVRTQYLSKVLRLVRNRELEELFKVGGRFPSSVTNTTIDNPAMPKIIGYKQFHCADRWDKLAYDCAKEYLVVQAQMSPDILCEVKKYTGYAEFQYIMQVEPAGFKIVDVQINNQRVYKDSYIDLYKMLKRQSIQEITTNLSVWSYLTAKDSTKDAIQAFHKSLQSPLTSPNRLPASKAKK